MKVRVATLGSCITRDNFNSKINPYYKQFFEVVASQNQTAIPSLMSEKADLIVSKEFIKKPPYTQELLHKEFNKEFLSTLIDVKPEYLIMDFDPDVKFGLLKLDDNTYITNNHKFRRIPQLQNQEIWNINETYEEYFSVWKESVTRFFEFMNSNVPDCKIILVKGRFEEEFTDGTSLNEMRNKKKLPIQDHIEMNKVWDSLDEYITNNYDVEVIDMVDTSYKLNKNHLWGPYYLHYEDRYYNTVLNKLIKLVYLDKSITLDSLIKTTQIITPNENYELLHTKTVEVTLNSNENIIEMARKDKNIYNLYKDLLKNDYILYFHNKGKSKLQKREYMKELWKRKDLYQQGDTFYTLDYPKQANEKELNDNKKLLVIFNSLPNEELLDNHSVSKRIFSKHFEDIEEHLVDNVHILRPMDLNLSHGSHYINTSINTNMEKDIVNTIKNVKEKLGIDDKDIVLYGSAKGGTGALYYSSLLDLKCLAVGPIISLEECNKSDNYFLTDYRKIDLGEDINNNLTRKSDKEKYIICSGNVDFNYSKIQEIDENNIKKLNKVDSFIKTNQDIYRETIPEQLTLLNKMLLNVKL